MPFVVFGIILIDQLSKYIVEENMRLGTSIPIMPDIFHITYILNPGAAFGILENQQWFFVAVALSLLLAVAFCYKRLKQERPITQYGVALLFGGAAGNLIDRVKTGYVVDFFDFRVWPIFNIADIAIVIGVGMIMVSLCCLQKKERCHE